VRELSLHILDALENSLEAGATHVELIIEEDLQRDQLLITIVDNGRGMDEEARTRVLDPFFTTRQTRHVGLGLPLFAAAAERCNGTLTVDSQLGQGTTVTATFQHSHIDRAPLGDMVSTLLGVLVAERAIDLHYVHRVEDRTFEFDTAKMREELGKIPLSYPPVRQWLAEFISEGEGEIRQLEMSPLLASR
jgi:anti-sigma regulatory factor (Ser/Thr protein kinase)